MKLEGAVGMKHTKWLAAALSLLLLAGCGEIPPAATPAPPADESSAAAGSEVQQPEPAPEPEPEPEPEPVVTTVTISAAGDVTLGTNQKQTYKNSFHDYYDDYGSEYFLQNVRGVFESDDFTIVNCEGTLTNAEEPMDKLWNHKGKPEYVSVLQNSSIEGVTLGNNHIMDYLQQGADDTMAAFESIGMEYALSGDWGNRFGLYETDKGIKIGFVSVNEHYDEARVYPWLEDGLKTLREQGAHLVFACIHWGGDKTHVLEKTQYVMGKWCIDQGYDLVLGCHAHVLQGIERYKGRYIVHSLGNFCYGGNKNPAEKDSMIFQQTFTFVDGVLEYDPQGIKVIPCRLSSVTDKNDYCPVVLEGEEAEQTLTNLNTYCEEFGTVFDMDGHLVEYRDTAEPQA